MPGYLVVFLEYLESEVALIWLSAWLVLLRLSWCLFLLDVNGVDHAEEVGVHFTECDQILAGQLFRQVEEHFVARDDFCTLPL